MGLYYGDSEFLYQNRVSTHAGKTGKPGKTGKSAFFQKHAGKTGKYILFNLCMLEKLEKCFFKISDTVV